MLVEEGLNKQTSNTVSFSFEKDHHLGAAVLSSLRVLTGADVACALETGDTTRWEPPLGEATR